MQTSGLETHEFCNYFGYHGTELASSVGVWRLVPGKEVLTVVVAMPYLWICILHFWLVFLLNHDWCDYGCDQGNSAIPF